MIHEQTKCIASNLFCHKEMPQVTAGEPLVIFNTSLSRWISVLLFTVAVDEFSQMQSCVQRVAEQFSPSLLRLIRLVRHDGSLLSAIACKSNVSLPLASNETSQILTDIPTSVEETTLLTTPATLRGEIGMSGSTLQLACTELATTFSLSDLSQGHGKVISKTDLIGGYGPEVPISLTTSALCGDRAGGHLTNIEIPSSSSMLDMTNLVPEADCTELTDTCANIPPKPEDNTTEIPSLKL